MRYQRASLACHSVNPATFPEQPPVVQSMAWIQVKQQAPEPLLSVATTDLRASKNVIST